MRNEAICCSSVLSTTPLLSAILDNRKTIVRDAKERKMLVEMVEMTGEEETKRRWREARKRGMKECSGGQKKEGGGVEELQ